MSRRYIRSTDESFLKDFTVKGATAAKKFVRLSVRDMLTSWSTEVRAFMQENCPAGTEMRRVWENAHAISLGQSTKEHGCAGRDALTCVYPAWLMRPELRKSLRYPKTHKKQRGYAALPETRPPPKPKPEKEVLKAPPKVDPKAPDAGRKRPHPQTLSPKPTKWREIANKSTPPWKLTITSRGFKKHTQGGVAESISSPAAKILAKNVQNVTTGPDGEVSVSLMDLQTDREDILEALVKRSTVGGQSATSLVIDNRGKKSFAHQQRNQGPVQARQAPNLALEYLAHQENTAHK